MDIPYFLNSLISSFTPGPIVFDIAMEPIDCGLANGAFDTITDRINSFAFSYMFFSIVYSP